MFLVVSCKTEEVYVKSKQSQMKGQDGQTEKEKKDEINDVGIHNLENGDKYIGGFKNNRKHLCHRGKI
jgi:hypothetical protein